MTSFDVIRVVYFGTPDVSLFGLEALVEDDRFEVVGVVTQPPKPVGRRRVVTKSPVHLFAEERGLRVLTPNKSREIAGELDEIGADLHVVVAFGQILPKSIVDGPTFGTLNVHPSLLPLWRGAAPVPATILNGDKETGVCIMVMDEKMDHGPILDVQRSMVGRKDTPELLDELMRMGAARLPDVSYKWVKDQISVRNQDHDAATFCGMLSKEDARADWTRGFEYVERMIRAYRPWPGVWTEVDFGGSFKRVKLLRAHLCSSDKKTDASDVLKLVIDNGFVRIGNLILDELQVEGKNPILGEVFAETREGLEFFVK